MDRKYQMTRTFIHGDSKTVSKSSFTSYTRAKKDVPFWINRAKETGADIQIEIIDKETNEVLFEKEVK